MKKINRSTVHLALATSAVGMGTWFAVPGIGEVAGVIGPDIITGSLSGMSSYGTVGGVSAYAIGTTSCNIGDMQAEWIDSGTNSNHHPVIAQNIWRIADGRLEQIGQSWVKHGFCALDQTLCGACNPGSGGCDTLGIGCSDPYSASLNGSQSSLGPRSQINAATGYFPYPFSAPAAPATVGRRCQVPLIDLTPASNPGAAYWGEAQYVAPDDATWMNDNNNASVRKILVGALSGTAYSLSLTGATYQQLCMVDAWAAHGLGAGIPDPAVRVSTIDVAGDGRFVVGSRAQSIAGGMWRYDYVIYNMNSHRSAQSFSVSLGQGASATTPYFRAPASHSGETYSTAPWTSNFTSSQSSWSTQTFAQNQNANAIRWGTGYTFSFVSSAAPQDGQAVIGLFRTGTGSEPTSINASVRVPGVPVPSADFNTDGVVNGVDLGILLANWGTNNLGDVDHNGIVDGADLAALLSLWNV
ncbi:MAG: hypothetical protein O2800_00995 [Planctomycetota bacterium]|nr:hypothetical protein [Planctomycetota bacterium]